MIYSNFFKRKESKNFSQKIFEFSKDINYPFFILNIIKEYSVMFLTLGDPYLDLIPKKKEQIDLMNINFNKFIFTKEQLKIFIEALELELQTYEEIELAQFKFLINEFIKNLKNVLKKLEKKYYLFKIKQFFKLLFFIFSPLCFFSLMSLFLKILPFTILAFFMIWFFYFCINFLRPYFHKKLYFYGFLKLIKKICYFFWSQKILIFFLFLIPNFGVFQCVLNSIKNLLKIKIINPNNGKEFNFVNFMFSPINKGSKNFQTFCDIATILKLHKFNIILNQETEIKKQNFEKLFPSSGFKKLQSSLIYRSWYRTPLLFKKLYGNAIEWSIKNENLFFDKKDFHSKLADVHAYTINDSNNFFYIKKISIQDQGHRNIIQGDEKIL